jgi:hypothetical protein
LDQAGRKSGRDLLEKLTRLGMVEEIAAGMAEVSQRLIVSKNNDRGAFGVNALELGADRIAGPVDTAVEGEVGSCLLTLRDVTEGVATNSFDDLFRNVWKHGFLLGE